MNRRKVLKEKRQQSWKISNNEQKRQKKTEDNKKMTTNLEHSNQNDNETEERIGQAN